MGHLPLLPALVCVAFPLLVFGENLQAWSHQTYKDKSYTLTCESDTITPSLGDVLTWVREGSDISLADGDHFELHEKDGVPGVHLHVKKVDDATKGIYICHVYNSSQEFRGSMVRGLNIGGHLYKDSLDKYKDNVIVGLIAGAGVFVFIVSVGLISHFRYLTEESLEKRQKRKDDRLARQNKMALYNAGRENGGADVSDTNDIAGSRM